MICVMMIACNLHNLHNNICTHSLVIKYFYIKLQKQLKLINIYNEEMIYAILGFNGNMKLDLIATIMWLTTLVSTEKWRLNKTKLTKMKTKTSGNEF